MDKPIKKVYGKSVNSGEESGWIERKSELINFEEENRKSQERIKESLNISIDEINYKIQEGLDKHSEKVKAAKKNLDDQYNELIKNKQAPSK